MQSFSNSLLTASPFLKYSVKYVKQRKFTVKLSELTTNLFLENTLLIQGLLKLLVHNRHLDYESGKKFATDFFSEFSHNKI